MLTFLKLSILFCKQRCFPKYNKKSIFSFNAWNSDKYCYWNKQNIKFNIKLVWDAYLKIFHGDPFRQPIFHRYGRVCFGPVVDLNKIKWVNSQRARHCLVTTIFTRFIQKGIYYTCIWSVQICYNFLFLK